MVNVFGNMINNLKNERFIKNVVESMPTKPKPCPFCGGNVNIVVSDGEGNIRDEDYEKAPWSSGVTFQLQHIYKRDEECPIATYDDDSTLGAFLYESRQEALEAWNTRA